MFRTGKQQAANPLRLIARGLADYRRRRRDVRRLNEMPDVLLEDIGLTRGKINAVRHRSSF